MKKNKNDEKIDKKNRGNWLDYLKFILVGIFSGVINGFFGAGGGLLLVPLCKFIGKLETKKSHATTLTCIWLMCLCGSIVYFVKKTFDLKLILVCLTGSILGSLVGTKLLKKLKSRVIDFIFSFVLIFAGIVMIFFH